MNRSLFGYEVQFGGFDRLMPHRVREILLVSSPYDAFMIAEDDQLTEIIFSEYLDLNLRYAPRVTRVSTAEEALPQIEAGAFDLIISMMRVGAMDIGAFARRVKEMQPGVPVVLLAYNPFDIERMSEEDKAAVDRLFLWSGDVRILLSIIKLVEDRWNVDADKRAAGVQAIILVEDSVRFYSSYLPLIYTELMKQTQRLMAEGVNLSHKMLRTRARPKILLAVDFEEAWQLYSSYREHLLGLITDVRFPRGGEMDPGAGLALVERVRKDSDDLPILIQSSDDALAERAVRLGACLLNKKSPDLLDGLRRFIVDNFGFGDFVFRLPDGREVGRANDLRSMVRALETVPPESLSYHAQRHHFSKWLKARTEFEIGQLIRPRVVADFGGIEGLRKYLISAFNRFLHKTQVGVVTEFSERVFTGRTPFVKLGAGSMGGKARGLAFLNTLLARPTSVRYFDEVRIAIPVTAVVATNYFDTFLERNDLGAFVRSEPDDQTLRARFLSSALPDDLIRDLRTYAERMSEPIAVRSSSLMEDSQIRPFAGIYDTYMLPNNHPNPEVRLGRICRAIKLVYASTFTVEARAYLSSTPHMQDEEKMAVILQRLVGRAHGERFYPDFAGVAQSYNFYASEPLKPTDGIAYVTLGLGAPAVEGGRVLSFSPMRPRNLVQFGDVASSLENSQREFEAVDLSRPDWDPARGVGDIVLRLGLEAAEADGTLDPVGSTYSSENDRIYDGIGRPGVRLVTFANILKSGVFPLADVLMFVLALGEESLGCPAEVEFAGDLEAEEFHILQVRPLAAWAAADHVELDAADRERAVCYTPHALGHGHVYNITDILYVRPERFRTTETRRIVREIGALNAQLAAEGRRYLLIGPGRWGTADAMLGVPVRWQDISAAQVIVETSLDGFIVEPSYGTHFLHNVISLGLGYLSVAPHKRIGAIDWEWLDAQPAMEEKEYVRHLRVETPLDIRIDGKRRHAMILRG